MPVISDYPKLRFFILGDYLEVWDGESKVVGYVHMREMDELAILSFAEEFITQARKKVYAREDSELEEKMAKARAQLYDQSSQSDPSITSV